MDDRKLYYGLALALILSLAAYSNTVHNSFHFDDYHSIALNPYITDITKIPEYFKSIYATSGYTGGAGGYRPIVTSSLALNYAISKLDTWSYHAFNIAFHLAVAVMVFLLAQYFLKKEKANRYIALLAAGIFGLHPAHTNAVTYIIARSAVLFTLFYLISFYAYARYRDSNGRAWLAVSIISFAVSLLSKEIAVTLPMVILLYEVLVRKERGLKGYACSAAFFIIAAVFMALRYAMYKQAGVEVAVGSGTRLMAGPMAIAAYLRIFVFPVNLNFYPDPAVPVSVVAPLFLLPLLLVAAAAALIFHLSKNDGLLAFCLAWFFVALIPETIVGMREPVIEYRLYLPSVGLVLLTALASGRMARNNALPYKKSLLPVLLILACFFALAFERNKVYRDDITLWRDTVLKSPRSALAHATLGESYFHAEMYKKAVGSYSMAVSIDPRLTGCADTSFNNYGWALEYTGDYEGALTAYKAGLASAPDDRFLLESLWSLSRNLGRPEEAVPFVKKALKLHPDDAYLNAMLSGAGRP